MDSLGLTNQEQPGSKDIKGVKQFTLTPQGAREPCTTTLTIASNGLCTSSKN